MEDKIIRIVDRVGELLKDNEVCIEILQSVPIIVTALVSGKLVLRSIQWTKKDVGKISISDYGIFRYVSREDSAECECLSTKTINTI